MDDENLLSEELQHRRSPDSSGFSAELESERIPEFLAGSEEEISSWVKTTCEILSEETFRLKTDEEESFGQNSRPDDFGSYHENNIDYNELYHSNNNKEGYFEPQNKLTTESAVDMTSDDTGMDLSSEPDQDFIDPALLESNAYNDVDHGLQDDKISDFIVDDDVDYRDLSVSTFDDTGEREELIDNIHSSDDEFSQTEDNGLLRTSRVLGFLAPQLNETVSALMGKAKMLDQKRKMVATRSRMRLDGILAKLRLNRTGLTSESPPVVPQDEAVKTTGKYQRNARRRIKWKKGKLKASQRKAKLEMTIKQKLEFENKMFEVLEPILSREPNYLLDEKLKEYTTAVEHIPNIGLKLQPKTNYCKNLNVLDFRKYEANDRSVLKALWDAMLFLKKFIGADDARIYHAKGDCLGRFVDEPCERYPKHWPIEAGTIAAAYAAHKGQVLCLDKSEFHNQNHPLGLAKSGVQPQKTAILPMLTPNKRVLAVMEFDRMKPKEFNEENIHYALAYGSWITAALIRRGIKESLTDAKEYNATILKCLKCFLHEKLTLSQCIAAIMMTMKDFVKAEKLYFYHLRADKKLDADVYESSEPHFNVMTSSTRKIDIRRDLLMKDVAENHVVVNIYRGDGDGSFQKYNITDPDVNSILCVPIGNPKRLLGIVKVINKVGHKMFFDIDLVNITSAGIYCTSVIFYTSIGKQLDNTITIANKQKVTLTHHMVPCPHDILQFRSRPITKPPPYYLSFDWYPTKDELARDLLADYAWWMFNDLFEGDSFMEKFDIFLLMCRKGYRRTSSYHNFEHAFCATHCMFVIVRTCSQKFSYLEQMALMCAMLCHDIDHPGKTNPFLKASEHPLSRLYKFAFLENHHSNVTRILIDYCKIFDHLSPTDYKAMVDDMHRLIIATDLAKHFRKKKYLDDLVKEKHFDESLPAHKMHLKSIIMTTCDLSGQFKPFDRTREITFNLYIELYREGDWLKSKGLPVHSTLDRTRFLDIPQDQVNFLSMVVIPCVLLLLQMVPVLKDPYMLSCNNIEIWKRVVFCRLFR